jgi:hypothetical protein
MYWLPAVFFFTDYGIDPLISASCAFRQDIGKLPYFIQYLIYCVLFSCLKAQDFNLFLVSSNILYKATELKQTKRNVLYIGNKKAPKHL